MISPKDIKSIEIVGTLNGKPVRHLRTKGGFNLFLGHEGPNKPETIIASASHRAIGLFQIEQRFPHFQPSLAKSESEDSIKVIDCTDQLKELPKKLGYKAHLLDNDGEIKLSLSKESCEVGSLTIHKSEGNLILSDLNLPKNEKNEFLKRELSTSLANIIEKLALDK